MILGIVTAFAAGADALFYWLVQPHPLLLLPLFVGFWVVGLLLAVGFLALMASLVDQSVAQERDSRFYRAMATAYIRAIVTLCRVRIRRVGMEQLSSLPQGSRYLLVCNHVCIADPVVLLHCFPKSQLAFISKKENGTMPIVSGVMHRMQCQLIDRENDRAALKTIIRCIQILKDDKASVAVFPEGYCSKDGLLRHFRSGVFRIAQKADVPIVVCTVHNTATILPNIRALRGSRVEMHLVGIVRPEEFHGETTVELSERIYRMMADDLGSELVYHGE